MAQRYCIFDTEYTTWADARVNHWGRDGYHKEILQIAAAVVTVGEAWESFPKFNVLVKPVLNPVVSDYAAELTGITNEKLAREGLSMAEALAQMAAFVGGLTCYSNGMDINVMAETCGLQKVVMPLEVGNFRSLSEPLYVELFKRFTFERSAYPSGRIHELMEIPLVGGLGQVHDAMRDVWSIHVALEWLRADGAVVIQA